MAKLYFFTSVILPSAARVARDTWKGCSLLERHNREERHDKETTAAKRDLAVCIGLLIGAFVVASYLDLFERWAAWSRTHEHWELDEALAALAIGSGALAWFCYRRWRETQRANRRYVEVNRDLQKEIMARQESDRNLVKSEERLRKASRLAKIGHYVWDTVENRCLFCSDQHASVYGLSPDEYVARSSTTNEILSLILPQDRHGYVASMDQLRNGQPITVEYRTATPSGGVRYIREVAEPIFDQSGCVVQEIGMSQDISELKRTEHRLALSRRMEAVGQLANGVAHEFNNLLMAISGSLEILQGELQGNAGLLRWVETAQTAIDRGATLTQSMLSYGQRQRLVSKRVDLNEIVSDTVHLLQPSFGGSIKIETLFADDLWPVSLDPDQMQATLLNLAFNARDAMPEGGVLSLETANTELDAAYAGRRPDVRVGEYVTITMADTGAGMPPDVAARAFEPFFTTKGEGSGSGLGLSMAYGFVKQSGGHIEIDSEVGHGTTARLYFARAQD